MTKGLARVSETVLPEFFPDDLGVPFKVVLKNSVRQTTSKENGEVLSTIIPNPRGLLQAIAVARLIWPRKLSGEEIKFIRKAFKFKATALAEFVGVTPEHLSRCEAGERLLSPGIDRYLRMVLLIEHFKLPELDKGEQEQCGELKELYSRYKSVLDKLKVIMNAIHIPAVYDAEDELCFTLSVRNRGDRHLSYDDSDEDWSGEEPH